MTPEAYCRNKAAPPGSSLHYALLFAPAEVRGALWALHGFRAEVVEIPSECSDPGVAAVKLGWWREELERALAGQARHPAAQALQQARAVHDFDPQPLWEVLDGVAMDLEYGSYPGFAQVSTYFHRVACAPGRLAVNLLGASEPATQRFAHDLAMAVEHTRRLRDVLPLARRGNVYIPADELAQAGLAPEQLRTPAIQDQAVPVFRQQAERARQFHRQALEQLPAADRRRQRAALVMGRLHMALLDVMEADGFPLLRRRYHLTALRKLWLAWRQARLNH